MEADGPCLFQDVHDLKLITALFCVASICLREPLFVVDAANYAVKKEGIKKRM